MCGGTVAALLKIIRWLGLSPRVRGNHVIAVNPHASAGSIPACAGESSTPHDSRSAARVYPRVCGGTRPELVEGTDREGLSPRVRGNPVGEFADGSAVRSIPACAGEPYTDGSDHCLPVVYPRVCGGTDFQWTYHPWTIGLSPRVRGNHSITYRASGGLRSIPACAGEPSPGSSRKPWLTVYPRVCGGTPERRASTHRWTGLSPRVRGNLHGGDVRDGAIRSIPACAGEPWGQSGRCPGHRVYPRVCGGTAGRPGSDSGYWGLSPRVRGNPSCGIPTYRWLGSIPACAGEPTEPPRSGPASAVYPRVCGGTW